MTTTLSKPKIYIVCGKTGNGKTTYITGKLVQAMNDKERYREMRRAIVQKNENGFNNLTIPRHGVYANYYIRHKLPYQKQKISWNINPFHIGFVTKDNTIEKVHLVPFCVIGITEGQKYFNARRRMPDWQSRLYEAHRHYGIDVYIDLQRFSLCDLNIRELAEVIEIQSCERKVNRHGKVSVVIVIRRFKTVEAIEKYKASGSKDNQWYTEETEIFDFDVFACFESTMMEPLFSKGHYHKDFDLIPNKPKPVTLDEYVEFTDNFSDEIPDGFYGENEKPKRATREPEPDNEPPPKGTITIFD